MPDYIEVFQQALELVKKAGLTQHELTLLKYAFHRYMSQLIYGDAAEDVKQTVDEADNLSDVDKLAISLVDLCRRSHLVFEQAYKLVDNIQHFAQQSIITEDTVMCLDADRMNPWQK